MPDESPREPFIVFSAAEASGDQHAAHVARVIRERRPSWRLGAFGGPELERAGCELYEDLTGHATMVLGFVGKIGHFIGVLRRYDRILREERPSAVVLIDSPGLNFLFARLARWRGVPAVYYICPQIWAWAPWRLRKVFRYTSLLLPILPFESRLYADGPTPVRAVGHPLADELDGYEDRALRQELGVAPHERLVSVFPGSRRQEVDGLLPAFFEVLRDVGLPRQDVRVVVSRYREEFEAPIRAASESSGIEVDVFAGDARRLMRAADFAIVASGTASLELAYFGTPMVVLYRTSSLGFRLFDFYRVTPWIALPNILGAAVNPEGDTVYEELFAERPSPEATRVARSLIDEGSERDRALERLQRMRDDALRPGGVRAAAEAILEFVEERRAGVSD